MEKIIGTSFFIFICFITFGQVPDSLLAQAKVDSLVELNKIFTRKGEFENAIDAVQKAKEIAETSFGNRSILYIDVLNRYADTYWRMADYPKADSLLLEALEIWEHQPNKQHLSYALTIENYAGLLRSTGKNKEAETLFLQALYLLESLVGKRDSKYAFCSNRIGILYYQNEELEKAKPHWETATSIWKEVHGEESATYSAGLHNLGNLNEFLSNYEQAIKLYKEAVEIRAKVLDENDPQYGITILCLATTYTHIGEFELAEPGFNQAIAIFKKSLGESHPYYLDCLNNLSIFYSGIGNYKKAMAIQLEVIDIQERKFGKKNIRYAEYLVNLALIYMKVQDYDQAKIALEEALAIQTEILLKGSTGKTFGLFTLAELYGYMGEIEKSEQLYLEVMGIQEEFGEDSVRIYAKCIANLGILNYQSKKYDKAIPLLEESRNLFLKIHNRKEEYYAWVLYHLAILYLHKGDIEQSESYVLESFEIQKQLLLDGYRHLSERELTGFIAKFKDTQGKYLSESSAHTQYASIAFDNTLFYKGFLQNGTTQHNRIAKSDSITIEEYILLKSFRRRLANEYSQPIANHEKITDLEERANDIEKKLARSIADFGSELQQVTWQEVQSQLAFDEAAIEFVDYEIEQELLVGNSKYAALIIRPGMEQPQFIPLFEGNTLNKQLLNPGATSQVINNTYQYPEKRESLNQLVYQPIKSALDGVTTIYYAPTGLLHRLNLEAIQIEKSNLLGDRYSFVRLGSTRQLVISKNTQRVKNETAMLFGAINYDGENLLSINNTNKKETANLEDENQYSNGLNGRRNTTSNIDFAVTDSTLRGGSWNYLKWTEVEIDAIELILEDAEIAIDTKRGVNATEEVFKKIGTIEKSPRILHLATHGFFFPDPKENTHQSEIINEPVFKVSNHPMIRSGLVLAGGNHAWKTGKPISKEREDGILTAYEISQMNLSDTELVVLSACETGLGDIEGNEGVYGLQRAFKIAGAKYLIMSLWQIPDFQTQELMTSFYVNWLEEGMEIPNAFRAAQQELKKRYPDPFSWAGFVLVE